MASMFWVNDWSGPSNPPPIYIALWARPHLVVDASSSFENASSTNEVRFPVFVLGDTNRDLYQVTLSSVRSKCDCKDFFHRKRNGGVCKHITRVLKEVLSIDDGEVIPPTVTECLARVSQAALTRRLDADAASAILSTVSCTTAVSIHRRMLDESDPCHICLETGAGVDTDPYCGVCRYSFHRACVDDLIGQSMHSLAESGYEVPMGAELYSAVVGQYVRCPHCRTFGTMVHPDNLLKLSGVERWERGGSKNFSGVSGVPPPAPWPRKPLPPFRVQRRALDSGAAPQTGGCLAFLISDDSRCDVSDGNCADVLVTAAPDDRSTEQQSVPTRLCGRHRSMAQMRLAMPAPTAASPWRASEGLP